MTNEPSFIAKLLVQELTGELSREGRSILDDWAMSDAENRQFMEDIKDEDWLMQHVHEYMQIDTRASWDMITARIPALAAVNYDGILRHEPVQTDEEPPVIRADRRLIFSRNMVAVWISVILGCSFAALLVYHNYHSHQETKATVVPVPASDQLYATYQGGPTMALQDYPPGWSTRKGNWEISKPAEGIVKLSLYESAAATVESDSSLLSLSTPGGGKYRIIMPDSSVVRLNAASSLDMAGSFNHQRRVILRGEGYFEVKPLNKQDFVVEVPRTLTITAIGTIFDVKGYADDSRIQVSLLSGHLLVEQPDSAAKHLNPGEAFVVDHLGQGAMRPGIDTAKAVSWKNGQFVFVHQPIMDILHELSRWYNIDFDIQGQSDDSFDFAGSRNKSLVELLDQLANTGHIQYSARDDKIIITLKTPEDH